MLDVCLLGTGGMMPMPNRWLTSLMLRCGGSNILIDCGVLVDPIAEILRSQLLIIYPGSPACSLPWQTQKGRSP